MYFVLSPLEIELTTVETGYNKSTGSERNVLITGILVTGMFLETVFLYPVFTVSFMNTVYRDPHDTFTTGFSEYSVISKYSGNRL